MESRQSLQEFVAYVQSHLRGDEKGEAQIYLDHFFQAFGWEGSRQAGAQPEMRIKRQGNTAFADMVWGERLLIEMKKRGENLAKHYGQAFDYWLHLVPNRPRYVMLCNFDEFWIYDFNIQLDEPLERIRLEELPNREEALGFMFQRQRVTMFNNNRVEVTRQAAAAIADAFRHLLISGTERATAQRFILQCVVAMFAEDFNLLPKGFFTQLLEECEHNPEHSYDLIGGLFRQMNNPQRAGGGRFREVRYFNGGLFANDVALELGQEHIFNLRLAANHEWSKVHPAIFGTIFENSLDSTERHALGAHFTSEADIQKVVLPTIVRPWRQRIESASTPKELFELRRELSAFTVLDPACGSGNFLYTAYREMKRLDSAILARSAEFRRNDKFIKQLFALPPLPVRNFRGMDINTFAVELARIVLTLGKEQALAEAHHSLDALELPFDFEPPLPLDNLDDCIRNEDALFADWGSPDAIIGNPPFQSKNKMQTELGAEYVEKVRAAFPDVPGRADYCVYWFRKAHDVLGQNKRAGLVGTNTIRQNFSREGGLDYIVANGGTITDAVATQVWSGDAAVHVSIVNWIKGNDPNQKTLMQQSGDNANSPWLRFHPARIPASLTAETDVTAAKRLAANSNSNACYQGQTHGHHGFLLSREEAVIMMKDSKAKSVLHPFLIGDELVGQLGSQPQRYAIDLNSCDDIFQAMQYGSAYKHVEQSVLPDMQAKAEEEQAQTGKTIGPRQTHLKRWWKFWRGRGEMISRIATIPRYIACARITKRPIFEFVDSFIRPNDALMIFAFADDYSFGVLQSSLHWEWFKANCSTMKGDFRYTSDTVFDTFPWAQQPTQQQVAAVAAAAVALRNLRNRVCRQNGWSLRELYRATELPGANPLRDAQNALDTAVRACYAMPANADVLDFLLQLNLELARKEEQGESVSSPGLPPSITPDIRQNFVTDDCVRVE